MVYLLRVGDGYRQVGRILEGKCHGPYLAVIVVLVEVGLLVGLEADKLAHRLVGRDPRPARHRPPGAVLHLELKPAPVALRLGELDEINPVLAQARNHVRDARPWFVLRPAAVEELDSRDAGVRDCGDVGGYAFLGRISSDDVKPRLRCRGRHREDCGES